MNRRNRVLLLLVSSIAALALSAYHLVRPVVDAFKDGLAEEISGALGMEAVLGEVRLSPASGFELSVKGLGARKDGTEALAMKELRVRLDLARLLRRETRITRLTLVAPVVRLVRHRDGSFNFGGGRPASGGSAAIAKVVVHQGRLLYTDERTGRTAEAGGLEFNLNNFTYGGPASEPPRRKIVFAGQVDCAEFRTGGLNAAGISLWLKAGKGVFRADPFELTVDGVAGGGSLSADLAGGAPLYRLAYVSRGFKTEDLLPRLYSGNSIWKGLRGTGVLRADVAAAGWGADELRRSLNGTLGFDGKNMRLPVAEGGPDQLRAEEALVTADAAAFAADGVRLKLVSLSKPEVYLRRSGGPGRGRAAGPAAAERPFLVDELAAAGGSFTYAGGQGAKLTSENTDLSLKGFAYGGRAGAGTAEKISFSGGEVKCSTLAFGGVVSTGVVAGVTASRGVFRVSLRKARLFRGEGTGSLRADLAASPPRYRLEFTLRRFRIGEFLKALSGGKAGPQDIKGRTELTADVMARGNNSGELHHSLAGRVALSGGRLALPGIDVDEVITKYVRSQNFNLLDAGAFLLAGPLGPAVTKSYNFADAGLSRGRNGVVLGLSSAWRIKDGTAAAEDVALATAKYRLAMKGGLDLADGHFDGVTVAVLDKKGCAAYTQKIQGTFAHPQLGKITMLASLAGPVLGVLETVEKLNPFQRCEVFYSGSVPQPK